MKNFDEEKISERNEYLKKKYGIDGEKSITASLIGILKNQNPTSQRKSFDEIMKSLSGFLKGDEDYKSAKDEYLRAKYGIAD